MATVTRNIGLSLGADLCWPAAYEAILAKLDLTIPHGKDKARFATERVMVEPFDLRAPVKYDVVLDRLTHWHPMRREWVKKAALDGAYILNNPWSIQANEKHTSYVAMMKLGMPIPETWMIPPKDPRGPTWIASKKDQETTIARYNKLFDLSAVGKAVGYPAFIKPYDGGGWVGVKRVTDYKTFSAAYDESGDRVQHLQAAVHDWDLFIRAIGVGPQVNIMKYDPDAPLHARYTTEMGFLTADEWTRATRVARTINAFFNWDFNSCEMLRSGGELHPIDFANACPDSQVTSLHMHFPWLVKAKLRWSIFCAATQRPMKLNPDWNQFFAARNPELSYDEQLAVYDALALKHFDAERFEAFNAAHLGELDAVALEYFGTQAFYDVTEAKVRSLFPAHEIKKFTDHFFGLVQHWRKMERDRLGLGSRAGSAEVSEEGARA